MGDVKITYETLFDLLRREKDRDDLQEIDSEFYKDILDYLKQKQSFLEADMKSGLFGGSEFEKTRIQIHNVKRLVKDLYERRLIKIMRLAFNKSKVNSQFTNTIAMLPQEQELYAELMAVFGKSRRQVLDGILGFGNGGAASAERPKADIKVKIRFKTSVPQFVGKEKERYGPYGEGDSVELPKVLADILVKQDKAVME
jgi:DNA replication initiation complex subunit (GINS family)